MDDASKSGLETLCKALGYRFKQPKLLYQAFRHSSYVNERANSDLEDNERLEFLGDAVLELAISHILMELFQRAEEGELSKFRAILVGETGLYQVAQRLGLGDYLLLGRGEEQSHGREKPSILADTTEALMGALYLDAGFPKTMEIIRRLFSPFLEKVGSREMVQDFKSLLQEYTQQAFKALPKYSMVEEAGPDHDKTFRVSLTLNGRVLAQGEGRSKKEAEQMAAKEAFSCLKEG
ncbi:MAG: ribonuclease III [Desulfobacteraceae bacterium]|nr:ribonuclease III [Desulfobacteraceae bacterium]